jgi:hypothetical protein
MKSLVTVLGVLAVTASVANAQGDVDVLAQAAAHANAGRHPQAIAIYQDVYARTGDHELLPVLGVEYRRTGAQLEAVQHFCTYLTLVPTGEQAWFATNQVIAIRRELGETIDATNVCAPVVPRVDFRPLPKATKSFSTRQRAAIASAAVGAVSLGVAVYFQREASSISDDLVGHPANEPWPADIKEQEERGMRAERRSIAFAAVGGAALVAAGVLWVTGREKSDTIIAPTVSASGGGVTLSRGF